MSKQNTRAIDDWKRRHVERITIQSHIEDRLSDRIRDAVEAGKAPSRQAYILQAIETALERDGISKEKG